METTARGPRRGLSKLLRLAFLATATFATAAGAQTLDWTRRAPMPVPTSRGGSGVVDRTLIALGGTVANLDGTFTPTNLVQAYDADLDAWRYLAPLPEARFAFASASYGGSVYLAGGNAGSPSAVSSNVLAYDLDGGGSVRPVGELLTPRFRTSAAVLNGKLYVVGGGAAGTTLASVEEVDLATGAAVEMPPLPAPRQMAGVAAFAGSIFVMGGHDASGAVTDTCWELRPPYGQWLSCASLPFPRAGTTGAEVAHGQILLPINSLGGSPTGWSDQVLEYDPRTDLWTVRGALATVRHGAAGVIQDHLLLAGADDATGEAVTEAAALDVPPWPVLPLSLRARMPTPRGGGVAAVIDDRIVVIAGSNRNDPPPAGALTTVEAFDVAANVWLPQPPIHEARFSAAGGVVGHTVYLAAGAFPGGVRADVLAYDAWTGTSWIDGALLEPRFRHGAAVIGSRIYVVGGNSGGALASVEAYDVDAHASTPVAPLPAPRDLPGAVVSGGLLYVLGGFDAVGVPATDVWAYDPATDAWTPRAPIPLAPGSVPATEVGGRIVVLGGSRDGGPAPADVLDAVQVYDPAADAWTVLGALDTFRCRKMVAAVGAEVFLIGGHDDSQALGLVEALSLFGGAAPISTIEWPLDGAALNLHDVVVSGTAWDDGDLDRVEVSLDGGATWAVASGLGQWTWLWQPLWEGQHLILSRAVDGYGTFQTPPHALQVLVDWTAPSIAIGTEPGDAGTGWWNVPVTVRFTCADALSGVASCPGPILLSAEGASQIASGTAWDRAGNGATAQRSVGVDLTPPTIAASPSSSPSAAGWWNAPVTVGFACADALSGVASCSGPVTVSTEGAGQQAAGVAADVAGNGAGASFAVNVDWTPPDVVAQPTTPPNAAGWWNGPVTVAFACSDALSGVASCTEPVTVPYEGFGVEVEGFAADRADNVTIATANVSVDMTPPSCTLVPSTPPGPDGAYHASVVLSAEAADALSGVAALEVDTGSGWVPYGGPFVYGRPGAGFISCRAVDAAGNEGMGVLALTISFAGDLSWRPLAPMPSPTWRAAGATVDRTLYVLGGLDGSLMTSRVLAYDADADAWTTLAPLPEPRTSTAVAAFGGTIYLAGGTGGPTTKWTVVAYDVDGGGAARWLANLQEARSRAAAAIFDGKLYVVGGEDPTTGLARDTIEEVDLEAGVSAVKVQLPAPRQLPGVAVYQGSLYVMGGLDAADAPTDTCWKIRLDPLGTWLPCATLPYPRAGEGRWAHGRILLAENLLSSGMPPTLWTGDVLAYDPRANVWTTIGQLEVPTRSAAIGVIQDALFVAGGTDGTVRATTASAPLDVPEWPVLPWQLRPRMPTPRAGSIAAVVDGRVVVLGGSSRDDTAITTGPLATAEVYDPVTRAWAALPPLAETRYASPGGAVDGVVYMAGGTGNGVDVTDTVLAYDVRTGATWVDGRLLGPRHRHGAAMMGNLVFVAGGRGISSLTTSVEAYDVTTHVSTPLPPLPATRDMAKVVAVGSRLFVLGGFEAAPGTMLELDFGAGVWVPRPPPPFVTGGATALAAANRIVVFGTKTQSGPAPTELGDVVQVYDAAAGTWEILGELDTFRYRAVAAAVAGELLLVGGDDGSTPLGLVEALPFDSSPPGTIIASPADGSATNAHAILIGGSAWDDSGVAAVEVSADGGASWALASGTDAWTYAWLPLAEGSYALASRAWDLAGLPQDPPAHASTVVDWTPPEISAAAAPPANAAGWWNAPLVVSFSCADALSGVAACPAPEAVDLEATGHVVGGAAADLAGNSASTSLAVNTDWTPPSISAAPTTLPNAAGWWSAPVTVAFTCSDARSGVASCPEPTTLAFECVGCPVGGDAADRAGNGAHADAYLSVDLTTPQCTVSASGSIGADGLYRSSAVVTVDAADALSGVAAVEVDTGAGWVPYGGPLVVGQPGTTVVTCRAFDAAGNEGWGTPLPLTIAPGADLAWTDRAPLPVPTYRAAAGVVDRTLYVLGGVDAAGTTRDVWAYDADAGAWRGMPPLPEPRTSAAVATLGATIYLAGGTGGFTTSSSVLAYDVDTGTSRVLGTLQTPRIRAGGAIDGVKLYVAGGFVGGAALDSVEEIDLATGASVTKLTLPAARQSAGIATDGGFLYVMGGLDAAGQPTDTCWRIRLAYPTVWTTCATLPYPRSGDALHGHGRILLANNTVSGLPPTAWTADVLAYDPSANAWSALGQRSTPSRSAALGVIQDALFVVGGNDGTLVATASSAPLHAPEWPVLPWQLRRHMPAPRDAATPVVVDGRVVLIGGTNQSDTAQTGAVATVEAYDPATDTWAALPPLLEPRYRSPGGAIEGVAYLAGGTTPGKPTLSDVLAYDVRTGTSWVDGLLLEPRFRHGAAVLGGRLYVAGGRGTSALLTSVEEYDPATHTSTPLTPLPGTRDMARVVAAAGRLFVLGGYETAPSTMLEYDFATGAWVNHPPPPIPIGGAPVVAVGRNIVVLGGSLLGPAPGEPSDAVQMYEPASQTWTVLGALDTFRTRASAAFLGGQLYLMGGDDGALPLSLVEAFTIDGTPPTSAILSPADGAFTNAHQLWVNGTAWDDFGIQGVDVSDDGGATWSRASGRSAWSWAWMPLAEGAYTLQSRATDSSGYPQDPPATARITVDWTPPEVSATAAPPANASGWWNAPVTVSFACSDALSGVASCASPVTVSSETSAAGEEVAGTAADRSGNSASASLTVKLDGTPPTCTVSAAGPVGLNGIYVSDVLVAVASTDALSGVAAVEVSTGAGWTAYAGSFTVSTEGLTSVSCRAIDAAGNAGTGALSFTIDRIAPSVASTSPSDGAVGVPATVAIAVTFAEPVLAGPAWAQITLLNGKKVVPVTVSIEGSVLTLLPDLPLERGRSYAVSIPAGAVTDLAGHASTGGAAGAAYTFGFTVAK